MAQKKRSSDRPSSSASLSLASRESLRAAAASPSIGPGVQRVRTQRGLSREALAEQVGVSAAALADVESGASEPSIDLTWSLANALGGNPINPFFYDLNGRRFYIGAKVKL